MKNKPQNQQLITFLIQQLNKLAVPARLMEVCGTHTMAIARFGLRKLFPEGLILLSGPGCPVCVCSPGEIDLTITLAQKPGINLLTFGDMIRVPGSKSSLLEAKANGASIKVVYSPLECLKIAQEKPQLDFVFLAVGFETTIPIVAYLIEQAKIQNLHNLSFLCFHKLIPPALEALLRAPNTKLDGLILPGHVSAIIGAKAYEKICAKYKLPMVVTGFEAEDILSGIILLLKQIKSNNPTVEIEYGRAVNREGNHKALAAIEQVFTLCDVPWRGFGIIPNSGLAIKSEYANWDAKAKYNLIQEELEESKENCLCGEVIRGVLMPINCPSFGKKCTPEHPLGPCMVSSEGSCAAYYKYN